MLGTKIKILVLVLLLVVGTVEAQDAAPWPPDPADIFAPGVEVLTSEIITLPPLPDDTQPIADDENRIVSIYDRTERVWHEYLYPDDATILSRNIHARLDGTVVFNEYAANDVPEDWPETWRLNLATGVFSKLEKMCTGYIQDLQGEGEWVLLRSVEESEEIRLCFTETGQESFPLPEEITTLARINEFKVSPDGKWMVMMGYIPDPAQPYGANMQVYSYELATEIYHTLGEFRFDGSSNLFFSSWMSDVRGTIDYGPPQESLSKSYYTFDVTQPNSLEFITQGWMYHYDYDDPPRYDIVTTTAFGEWKTGSSGMAQHDPCKFTLYNAAGVHETYELGYDCAFAKVVRANAEAYLYIRIDSNPDEFSTLVQLNPYTGTQTALFEGEIESIEGVSPDGRYALLVMDRSGRIDLVDRYSDFVNWNAMPEAYLVILDTVSQEIIYRTGVYRGADIEWLADNRLFLLTYTVSSLQSSGRYLTNHEALRLINLNPNGYTETKIDDVPGVSPRHLSPDHQYLIATRDGKAESAIIRLADGSIVPFLSDIHNLQYVVYSQWVTSSQLQVRVSPKVGTSSDPDRYAVYTIQIPQSES